MSNGSETRRFEYKDEKSSKFWEIQVFGNAFTVRYGKIGTDGQMQTKEFADAATAEKQAQKLITEKVEKGYQEVGASKAAASQENPTVTEKGLKATKVKLSKTKETKATKAKPATASETEHEPLPVQERLINTDVFTKQDMRRITEFSESLDDQNLKNAIETYVNSARPYCVPKFFAFDRDNPEHRKMDQIFCGFPYTSAKHPWPQEDTDDFMQPVVQIDLIKAGRLLGVSLGEGLLQVWGSINDSGEMIKRVISSTDLDDPLDNFYPDKAPWLDESLDFDGCVVQSMKFENEDVQSFNPRYCRVDWLSAGMMFYAYVSNCLAYLNSELLDQVDDQLDEITEQLSLPGANSLSDVFGKKPLVHLGGYPEDYGNIWANFYDPRSDRVRMLFYHSYDQWECIGVTFEILDDGKVEFVARKIYS